MNEAVIEHKNGYIRISSHYIYLTSLDGTGEIKYLKEKSESTYIQNKHRIKKRTLIETGLMVSFIISLIFLLPFIIAFPFICILSPVILAKTVTYFRTDFNFIYLIPMDKIIEINNYNSTLTISFFDRNNNRDQVILTNLNLQEALRAINQVL